MEKSLAAIKKVVKNSGPKTHSQPKHKHSFKKIAQELEKHLPAKAKEHAKVIESALNEGKYFTKNIKHSNA